MNEPPPEPIKPLIHFTDHDRTVLGSFDNQLLIACSGGIDSVVLLHQLCTLRRTYPQLKLTIAHINFHLNEPYASDAAKLVQRLAQQYKVPLLPYDPYPLWRPGLGKSTSFELWARQVKTAMIHLAQSRAMAIALAHHQDDVAETIIMRLIRGSQPWNLAGLTRWRGGLFRPLLEVTKAHLLTYAKVHELTWQDDPTNHLTSIHRGHIRHRILPALTARRPDASQHLIRYAHNCRWLKTQLLAIMSMSYRPYCLNLKQPQWLHGTMTLSLALELLTGTELKMSLPWLRELLFQLRKPPQHTHQLQSYPIPGGNLLRQDHLLTWRPHTTSLQPSRHYDLYPNVAITTPGPGHHTTLTLQTEQRCRVSLYSPDEYMAAASAASWPYSPYSPTSLRAIVQPFKRRAQGDDLCPEADLALICQDGLIMLAISWNHIYRVHVQLPASGADTPRITYKRLSRGREHQWKLPGADRSSVATYELKCTHTTHHQPDVVVRILRPGTASLTTTRRKP